MDWRGELIVLWFKVESEIVAHRKTRLIPRTAIEAPTRTAAMGVWLFAAAWSAQHESDGFVPGEEFERWDPNGDLTPYLVEVGYLEDAAVGGERGYRLHDWLDVQRSKAQIDADRAEDAAKKARMRASKAKRSTVPPDPDDDPPGLPLDIPDYVPSDVPEGHDGGRPRGTPQGNPERVLSLEQSRVREELKDLSDDHRTPKPVTKRQEAGAPFEEFYKAYPRREKPEDAAKAYLQVTRTRKIPHSTVMAAVRRYAATRRGQDPQYTSLPASWLRGGAYENEPLRAVSSLNDY